MPFNGGKADMKFLARLLKKVSSINTFLSDYLALIGGLIILLLMLAVVGGAISRYFFGRAVASVTELSAYSLLFITFLGGPFLARTNGHISVDLLPTILRERSKKVVTIVTNLFSFLTSIVLAWYGFENTDRKSVV